MSWGAWGRQFSTQEMIAQINTSLEAGITTFDHADIYGEYTTEHEAIMCRGVWMGLATPAIVGGA